MTSQLRVKSESTQSTRTPRSPGGVLQRKCACGNSAEWGGACRECQEKSRQSGAINSPKTDEVPSLIHEVLRSPGQPLDAATRAFMEPRLGHSFSRIPVLSTRPQSYSGSLVIGAAHDQYEREADANASRIANATTAERRADFAGVRVHTDSRAAESARAVGARAYTVGHQVVFDAGRYSPQTNEGRALLAHELTHVLQQTGGDSAALRRQPDGGEEEKADAPPAKIVGCDKDQQDKIEGAIKQAEALASGAVQAFEREYPMSYEMTAMKGHFGSLRSNQKSTIIERYKHIQANLGNKTYNCVKKAKRVRKGKEIVDLCGQAACPGSKIILYPDFGKETCPAGPALLHEAAHNAGACADIDKNGHYPPASAENNAYSYEYFALDVAGGYKAPSEPKKHKPTAPKIND